MSEGSETAPFDYAELIQAETTRACSSEGPATQIDEESDIWGPLDELLGKERMFNKSFIVAHRGLYSFIEKARSGQPVFIVCQKSPEVPNIHLGHIALLQVVLSLQRALGCPVIIEMKDEQRILVDPRTIFAKVREISLKNARSILGIGFDPTKTFIFNTAQHAGVSYRLACQLQRLVSYDAVAKAYGFTKDQNIGLVSAPSRQMVSLFAAAYPDVLPGLENATCLFVGTLRQDPIVAFARGAARISQDVYHLPFPCSLYVRYVPGLRGMGTIMESTGINSALELTDKPNSRNKINKFAFSGGRPSAEEQKRLGADMAIDVSVSYCSIFDLDDSHRAELLRQYRSGELMTGYFKAEVAKILDSVLVPIAERCKTMTDDDIRAVMAPHSLII